MRTQLLRRIVRFLRSRLKVPENVRLAAENVMTGVLMGGFGRIASLYALSRPARRQGESVRALLLPGDDPGGVGDDAMMQAVLAQLRCREIRKFGVAKVYSGRASLSDYGPGVTEENWTGATGFLRVMRRYQVFYIFGADVMDGYYSEAMTSQRILYAHLAAVCGRASCIIGFSFNRTCTAKVARLFRRVHPNVAVFLRDPDSLQRFQEATGRSACLTADVAFLLQASGPTRATRPTVDWIENRRTSGRRVVAMNLSPVSIREAGPGGRERCIACFVQLLEELVTRHEAHVLLLPHDYRDGTGDVALLASLFHRLPVPVRRRTLLVEERLTGAEVKEICGSLHAVISGRMHLCIAALGRGVPAFGLSYQDKFHGLMRHFHTDRLPVLEVDGCRDGAALREAAADFLARHGTLKTQIESRLPAVTAMAMENLPFP